MSFPSFRMYCSYTRQLYAFPKSCGQGSRYLHVTYLTEEISRFVRCIVHWNVFYITWPSGGAASQRIILDAEVRSGRSIFGCLPRTTSGCLPRTTSGCLPRTTSGCLPRSTSGCFPWCAPPAVVHPLQGYIPSERTHPSSVHTFQAYKRFECTHLLNVHTSWAYTPFECTYPLSVHTLLHASEISFWKLSIVFELVMSMGTESTVSPQHKARWS